MRFLLPIQRSVVTYSRNWAAARRFINHSSPVIAFASHLHARHLSTPLPQSEISFSRYHELSDTTMDALLESLETLLDKLGNPSFEVEYHVSRCLPLCTYV
jgi:hypothetical protein